jgi:putative membrane-bound dehydrogenase-like protein
MYTSRGLLPIALGLVVGSAAAQTDTGNRLNHLDEFAHPYWVGAETPKLVTPQWIGEDGVEAVVVLSIDDMRHTGHYEAFLRPILDRLEKIEGRAPLSIFTNAIDPKDPQLQTWLDQGLSIEVHTTAHPCPCLGKRGLNWAKRTYYGCVDALAKIPRSKPVAFRMPCCDSMNSVSPRFFAETFDQASPGGNFLEIDSSVFHLLSPGEQFSKYVPHNGNFVNLIENYPYPYVIGKFCWELPCSVPSDWEAQAHHGNNNPRTVTDMKAAIDETVARRGVYTLVFHPHGWITNAQIVELIDHVAKVHGDKVAFLSMREVRDRLNKNLLGNTSLRNASGTDNGVRILDVNHDGYMDVVLANPDQKVTRIWNPKAGTWQVQALPAALSTPALRFGVVQDTGAASVIPTTAAGTPHIWHWIEGAWRRGREAPQGVELLHDFNRDGVCELLTSRGQRSELFEWNSKSSTWHKKFTLPAAARLRSEQGGDAGLRLVDVDRDGRTDLLFSDHDLFGVWLLADLDRGFTKVTAIERRDGAGFEIPAIVDRGSNNGAWFTDDEMIVQNERTGDVEPHHVKRLPLARIASWARQRHAAGQKRYPGGGALVPIGTAQVDITPTFPIRLAGYAARTAEVSKITQGLSAKAIVLGNTPATRAVLVTVDNCGVPAPVVEAVATRVSKSLGIRRDRFVLTSTHTHSAPVLRGYAPMLFDGPLPADQQKHVNDYTDSLIEKLCDLVQRAAGATRSGRLAWGQGQVRFAKNRRLLRNARWRGFGVQTDGPVDHDMPILRATDENGKLLAVIANYACHCTSAHLDDGVCGDWAGCAQQFIEKAHPGTLALITIGCGADVNPSPMGSQKAARAHGQAIAREVNRLLEGNLTPIEPQLTTTLRHIDLPFAKLPPREYWQQRSQLAGSEGYQARTNLARLDRGEKLPTKLSYPIATWSFGEDLLMVFLAGEVVVDYATFLKRALDSRRLWISGWANDVPCYIPSQRILREGGYEADGSMVYYDKPTRFADQVEPLILAAVKTQAPTAFHSSNRRADTPSPRSPAEALASMSVAAELAIELVAAEPLIVDPVAFDWGPDGRLWVVEMRDYPTRNQGVPSGRVRILTDTDGDGKYDRASTFLEGLSYPTGIKVWRKGILITAAPDILYAEDRDGDGKAEPPTALYTGFGEGNQQHRVNGLRWRLDNWLQVANGDSGGTIRAVKTGASVNVRGRDLRIDVDRGLLDPQSGQTQFGTTRDDWGNWFGGDNSRPLWHYVLTDHYLRRNPHVTSPSARRLLVGSVSVYPGSRTLERFNNLHVANRFTSACSPMVYRDSLLGESFAGSWFVCEPVHNLVHRQVLKPDGVTFSTSRPADAPSREFLTSSDNWFRPTMVRTGPDGAIWLADMYRFVIEHPTWIPARWQQTLDLRAGSDRGRIYRIYPRKTGPRRTPRLDRLDTAELVAALDTENGWQRDMVQQMLLWRRDPAASDPLVATALRGTRPVARLHALYTLAGLGQLQASTVATALGDPDSRVRRHALRLGERFLATSDAVVKAALACATDPEPALRMQLAYSLGEWKDPRAARALAILARRDSSNPYIRSAILSSAVPHVDRLLIDMLAPATSVEVRRAVLGPLLRTAAASTDPASLERVVRAIVGSATGSPETWRLTAMRNLLDTKTELAKVATPLLSAARSLVGKASADTSQRVAAAQLLGREASKMTTDLRLLSELLVPSVPLEIQRSAIAAFGRLATQDTPSRLLSGWATHSPGVRHAILDILLSRSPWAAALVDHAHKTPAFARQIDIARRAALMSHPTPAVQKSARDLFGKQVESSRAGLVSRYTAAIQKLGPNAGDARRGRTVYAAQCALCHRLQGTGNAVGPDLAALTDRSSQSLLVAILDPNRALEAKYENFLAELTDQRALVGVISEESGASITLVGVDGKPTVIPRHGIKSIRGLGRSLMPEGFEILITAQQMSDLIRYLRNHGPAPKKFPGNQPELVRANAKGVLTLPATKASIYGGRLIFEPKYQNLGWWERQDDHAIWTIETARPGRYRVEFDFACDAKHAGSSFILTVGPARLTGRVPSTGTWDDYVQKAFGEIQLAGGADELVVRSVGDPRSAMIDLRTVRLIPIDKR